MASKTNKSKGATTEKQKINKKVSQQKIEKTSLPKSAKSIQQIRKRNGNIVDFNLAKITSAIFKAMTFTGEGSYEEASVVAVGVLSQIAKIAKTFKDFIPTVEGVQDVVEQQLILSNYVQTSKRYILYREEHARIRSKRIIQIPEHVRKLAQESKKYFRNPLAEFVYYRTYSKWIADDGRRETWIETVDRYLDFMKENIGSKLKSAEYKEIREAMLKQKAMPSMRLMQFAGKAARRTNVCAYNCSYIAPEKLRDLSEIMYISMCGTGVGFSVSSESVQKFPQIKKQAKVKPISFRVPDSKEGWCEALELGLKTWFEGKDIIFDYSLIRPEGARLKVMGGKASGPDPLRQLLEFTHQKILARQGRRLTNLDIHDIICMIGQIVVVGGVRRSAMISLSDLDDIEMRDSKKGQFWSHSPQRTMANNSAIYEEKPTAKEFLDEWRALVASGSGERGIFNRGSLDKQLPKRRIEKIGRGVSWGTNPCGEIILQSKQFCNLSEVVCRQEDTEKDLLKKIRVAVILGTYQASLVDFGYLSKEWKQNCQTEALLGISLTGQWDCPVVRNASTLQKLKKEAIRVNKIYAKRFGINTSTCITTAKPSGTVSQVVDSASGMHSRHAKYYIRRIRIGKTDSLFKMLKDQNIPYYPEVGFSYENTSTFVLEFPVKSPKGSITKNDLKAIDQLEHWKLVKENYTEHNPSVTISVSDDEWIKVGNWVYENWDIVGGLSFLPRNDHVYQLAPYEEVTKEKYNELLKKVKDIDFSKILAYEKTDETNMRRELACTAGACDIDDVAVTEAEKALENK